jgi:hypothetical protein
VGHGLREMRSSDMRGRVIIVSPHFPPSTVAGVHRARHLARHLPACGWEPIIICVDEIYHTERLDPGLAGLLPADVRVVKVPALPISTMRRFGIGDIGLRGYGSLSRALRRAMETENVDAVLITGSPFYPFLLAGRIKRKFSVPVALDFQDPWVSKWGASRTPLTKGWAAHQLARILEPRAVAHADFITSVSERQNDELLVRYPAFPRDRVAAIPIGGDAGDYDYLRQNPLTDREVALPESAINISYVGTMLPRSRPLLEALFSAVRQLTLSGEEWVGRLRLNFVGTSNQPNGFSAFGVAPLAEKHGIAHLVNETPQRIPYLQALDVLANSHALLLIGSDEPHYTASKIYPALLSGRPYLALFHRASSAYDILRRSGGGVALSFETLADLERLGPAVATAFRDIALAPQSLGPTDPAVFGDFEASRIAGRFAAIFDRLAA